MVNFAGDTMLLGGGPALTGALAGELAVSDYLAVTSAFTLSGNGILLSNGQAWQSLGFLVGQKVYVPGYGVRTIVGYANAASLNPSDSTPRDGAILLVDGLAFTTPSATLPLPGTVSVTSRNRVTGGTVTLTTIGDGGKVVLSNSVNGTGLALGQQVWITGVNDGTRTIDTISADGKTLTVSGGAIPNLGPTSGTVALVRIGGDAITLTGPNFAGSVNTAPGSLTRTGAGNSWAADGLTKDRQVILGGGSIFNVTSVVEVKVGGVVMSSTLNVTLVSGTALGTATGVYVTVTQLPTGAGPGQPYDKFAPLVIYGDTSQDGVWYGGDPHNQTPHNFGPKPMPHIEGATVTLARSADGFTGFINLISSPSNDFRKDGFAVGNELALGPEGALTSPAVSAAGVVYDIYSTHLTRHTGSWVTDGFKVNQVIHIGDLPGTWTVKGFANDPLYGT